MVIKKKEELNPHIETVHNDEKDFSCEECTFISKVQDKLNRHIETVHNDGKKISCQKCSFVCNSEDELTRHIKTVHKTTFPQKVGKLVKSIFLKPAKKGPP